MNFLNAALLILAIGVVAIAGGCSSRYAGGTTADATTASAAESDAEASEALRLIEKMPNSPLGYRALAVIYMKRWRETGDSVYIAKSRSAVDRGLGLSRDDQTLRKLNASLRLSSHRFAEALELGEQLEKELPDDPFVLGVLTDANAELGNYAAASEYAQKMVDVKPNSVSYARVASIRSLYGDHAGSVEAYKLAARTADPADREARAWCLSQLGGELWKNGKYAEANAAFDEALQIFSGYHLALAGKGRVLASLGDLERAAETLIDAQNRLPGTDTVILLGDVYSKLGDDEKARRQAALAEVVEQKLGLAGDQKRLALFWADGDTKLKEALEIAEREFGARKDIYTADVYAWCLLKNNRADEAAKIIVQAMRLKTGDARILYHAGMIANARGDKPEAKRLLALALRTNPVFDLKQAENAKRSLESF